MTINPARPLFLGRRFKVSRTSRPAAERFGYETFPRVLMLVALVGLLATIVFAQTTPRIQKVDPPAGKVNDTLTVSGISLGKDAVAAIFLSDDKSDFKATIVSQAADKIVMKVPQVKPGGYNVSIQVGGGGILIEPVRFTVQE
jgi:hypothetical protein